MGAGRPTDRRPSFARTRGNGGAEAPAARAQANAAGRQGRNVRTAPTAAVRVLGIVMGLAAIVGLLLVLAYVILANTSVFAIASIDAEPTEHVSAESIARLANVPEGTTLLNVNAEQIREGLRKNPWIADAEVIREFPNRLRIVVTERAVGLLVMMGTDGVVWRLGSDYVWIEPLDLVTGTGQTLADAALAEASSMGALLVSEVSAGVSPQAASRATDDELEAVASFCRQFNPSFLEQVVSMAAPSADAISCVLSNGVEVSLGAPTNVATKEQLVNQLLERYPNRITYINVRVTSNPSYRLIDSESVRSGTGALGDLGNAGNTDNTNNTETGAVATATSYAQGQSSADELGYDGSVADASEDESSQYDEDYLDYSESYDEG